MNEQFIQDAVYRTAKAALLLLNIHDTASYNNVTDTVLLHQQKTTVMEA